MSDDDTTMTLEEADAFLRDVLSISSPLDKLKSNPESLLLEMIMAWFHHLPFQSIKALYTPHDKRHKPTFSEIKEDMFGKLGGLCYDHNIFCYAVLHALGYNVYLAACEVSFVDSHAVVIVRNLTGEGSLHMVDVGTGYPTFRVVPFDFEHESPEYHDSYLWYRFVRKGDLIIRQHRADVDPRAALWPDRVENGWYSFIYMDFKHSRHISHFHDAMTTVYAKLIPSPPYLSSPRCMTWPNGRFVCIKDTTLLLENEGGKVEKSYFQSPEDLLEAYRHYFSHISQDMIKSALNDVNVKLVFGKKK